MRRRSPFVCPEKAHKFHEYIIWENFLKINPILRQKRKFVNYITKFYPVFVHIFCPFSPVFPGISSSIFTTLRKTPFRLYHN